MLLLQGCTLNYTIEQFFTYAENSATDHGIQDNDETSASTEASAEVPLKL